MRNKKIIALVCAISMIFSMLASFTVVNAEATKGISLEISQESNTVAKVTATYVGFADGINGANVVINFPVGATVTYTKPDTENVTYTENREKESEGIIGLSLALLDDIKLKDNLLTEFTITVPSEMSSNAEIALQAGSYVSQMATETILSIDDNSLAAEAVTMKADINAEEQEPFTKDTDYDKDKVTIPETKTPVEVPATGGIDLEYSKVSDTVAKVTATYVGFADGINGANVVINFPVGATVTYTKPDTENVTYTENREKESEGIIGLSLALLDDIKLKDNLLTEFTITYPADGIAEDFICELQAGSYISQMATEKILSLDDGLVGDWVTLPATTEDDRNVVELEDKISSEAAKAADASEDDAYLAIEATDEDGNPATYGDDYEAYYNGKKINEDTMKALLAGGVQGVSLEDAVKGLSFKYNDGVKIKFQLVQGDAVADNGETEDNVTPTPSTKPSDKSADGKIASNVSKSLKSTDSKQTATFTTTAAKDKDGAAIADNDKVAVTINIKKTSYDAITGAGIEVAYQANKDAEVATAAATTETKYIYPGIAQAGTEVEIPVSVDGKYVVSFTPAAKGTVEYTITYTDANGKKSTATAKYTIAAASTEKSSSGSGSGSSSSGGGAIASGLVDTTIGGYIPGIGFSDMADASWANEAVNALANQKIVSGVGDNKFDPNGELTRAAYAQMLVNAIGHSQDSADVEFNDVPTDAWFYHNVAVAAQLGIVSGYGDGNFGPNDLITREQMALMTQKAAQVTGVSLAGADAGTFTDDADIADWSRDAVYTLANAGIINGMGDGTFAPKANATRAQAAVIIYNTFVK